MPLFCTICDNLLSVITTSDEFYFKCIKCNKKFDYDASDTLRYEEVSGTNLLIYKTILQHAGQDPVNPKVLKQCDCGEKIIRQVRLGDDMKLINVCPTCDKQWVEGTHDE